VVAFDLKSRDYFRLNGTGTLLWRELEHGATPEELADRLCESFGVDGPDAQEQVERFLDELRGRDLLKL
jgi:hypothetical protein